MYKLNMFFREWEGYDKVYNFLKEYIFWFLILKLVVYISALTFCLMRSSILTLVLRIPIYFVASIIEYFIGCIQRENNEIVLSFSSYLLMILDFLVVIASFIRIFVQI